MVDMVVSRQLTENNMASFETALLQGGVIPQLRPSFWETYMAIDKKSYYAIIPAIIRYDNRLTPNAKLLYGEITALCNEKGYCWSRNKYFADLYKVSKTSISTWIQQLKQYGYIKIDIKYKEGTKEILHRYIRLLGEGMQENLYTPMQENFKDNNTLINNTMNKRESSPKKKISKTKTNKKTKEETDCFKEIFDFYKRNSKNFHNNAKERKGIWRIIENAKRDQPEDWFNYACNIIAMQLYQKNNSNKEFWKTQTILPSIVSSDRLWPIVANALEDLKEKVTYREPKEVT